MYICIHIEPKLNIIFMNLAATFAKILQLKSHTSALPRSNLKPGWSQCNREFCGRHKMKLTHTLVSDPKNPTEVGLSFQQAVGFFRPRFSRRPLRTGAKVQPDQIFRSRQDV